MKRIPTPTQDAGNWGTILNDHLAQTKNPTNGAFNSFDQFSLRPTTLTADDVGKTFLYTQTGNWHEWSGSEWKVQNKSEINVKDYGAIGDGIANDTVAIQSAITIAKNSKNSLYIPNGIFLVGASLEVSGLEIFGSSFNSIIKANRNQFDIFSTVGQSVFRSFCIDGSWDEITPNQIGNSINMNSPTFGNITIQNMNINYSKQNAIKLVNCGYTSIFAVTSRVSGENGLYMYGVSGNNATTTVDISGSSTFSDCPFGFGVKIENGINISLNSVISENTKGFGIYGNDNRNINITNCYQENTIGGKYLTWNGAGQYMNIFGNYGASLSLDYYEYFYGVNFLGNQGIALNTTSCYNWNMVQNGITSTITTGQKQILGLNATNESGGTPAHILNTSPMSGTSKKILLLKNGGNDKFSVNSEGGISVGSSQWDIEPMKMGNYRLWVDVTGVLRIKNGLPTGDVDGTVVGAQQ